MGLKRGQTWLVNKKKDLFFTWRPTGQNVSRRAFLNGAPNLPVSSRKIRCLFQRLARQAAGVPGPITLLRAAALLAGITNTSRGPAAFTSLVTTNRRVPPLRFNQIQNKGKQQRLPPLRGRLWAGAATVSAAVSQEKWP